MLGKTLSVAAVAGLIALGGAGIASAATPAAGWHIIKSVKTGTTGDFGTVVATGKTTGWAFDQTASGPVAWARTGTSTWKTVAFPAKSDETIASAVAASPSDVWAFADTSTASRALHWNGHTWSVMKTFAAPVANASIAAANDLWVFGNGYAPNLGVWHYDGRTWTRVSTNLTGGSALSASDVWGFSGTNVDHWNGHKWTSTSVKNLLPPVQANLNDPGVYSVLALSADNVYAVGNGRQEDAGGPIVVLHYNGHTWTRVADGANNDYDAGYGGSQLATDGSGGLWIPTWGEGGTESYLLHYSNGKLTAAKLPVNAGSIEVQSVSHVPGTSETLTGGFTHTPYQPTGNQVAVILQNG
jgi:hypothetical protein